MSFLDKLNQNRVIEEFYLYEGLIYTYNVSSTVSNLKYWNNGPNIAFFRFGGGKFPHENRFGILITNDLQEKELENVLIKINNFGWEPSYYYSKNKMGNKHKYNKDDFVKFYKNEDRTILVCDAKFDLEVIDGRGAEFLYHITPLIYKDKVLKIGLAPKSKNKKANHSSRVYLAFDENSVKLLLNDKEFYPNENLFVVFRIKLKDLIKTRRIRFFDDPAFSGRGLYTYENIPPNYIEVYKEIDRNKL